MELDVMGDLAFDATDEQVRRWIAMSARTSWHLRSGRVGIVDELDHWSRSPSEGPFRAAYRLWSGIVSIGIEPERGRRSLADVGRLEAGEGPVGAESSLGVEATRARIVSMLDHGLVDDALAAVEDEADDATPDIVWEAACECGSASVVDVVRTRLSGVLGPHYHSQGRRADDDHASSAHDVVRALVDVLVNGADADALFDDDVEVGAGAHFMRVDRGWIARQIERDRRRRPVRIDDVVHSDDVVDVATSGWRGDVLRGRVTFSVVTNGERWSVEFISLLDHASSFAERLVRSPRETNQPLPFAIKAPWDRGGRRAPKSFMAGGIEDPGESPIITESRGFLGILGFIPIFGEIARATDLFLAPVRPAERARQIALAARSCGFGLRGFYYNAFASHDGSDAFAIDFSAYDGFREAGDLWPVLAAAPGRVHASRYTRATGRRGGNPNLVEIMTRPSSATPTFLHRYLHLAAETPPPVIAGMFVAAGQFIGRVNTTGRSVFPHLHFSIHDQSRPHPTDLTASGAPKGFSVRPTPMDGQRLGDTDESRCVTSSNGGPPTISITNPTPSESVLANLTRLPLNCDVGGGASPLLVTWTDSREPRSPLASIVTSGGPVGSSALFTVPGTHELVATVTDALSRAATDSVSIVVNDPPPRISILAPYEGSIFEEGEVVPLIATSWDPDRVGPLPDGVIAWFVDGATTPVATSHRPPYVPAAGLGLGRHTIRVVGRDATTEVADERAIEVVSATGDTRPTAIILEPAGGSWIADQYDATLDDWFIEITLRGIGTDSEDGALTGDALRWAARRDGGSLAFIGSGEHLVHRFRTQPGPVTNYVVELTATDSSARTSHPATIAIAVSVLM